MELAFSSGMLIGTCLGRYGSFLEWGGDKEFFDFVLRSSDDFSIFTFLFFEVLTAFHKSEGKLRASATRRVFRHSR